MIIEITDSSNDTITGKQLSDLAGKLGVDVNIGKTGFDALSFTEIKGSNSTTKQTTFKGAIDDLITAVNKGLMFKGNDNNETATIQLGEMLTLDSSVSEKDATNEKDIKISADSQHKKLTLEAR